MYSHSHLPTRQSVLQEISFQTLRDPASPGDHQDKPRYRSDEGVDLKLASGKEGQMVWTHKLPAQNVLSCFVLHYGVR